MSEYRIREQAYIWLMQKQEQTLSAQQELEFKVWLDTDPEHTIAFAEAELMWHALADENVKTELKTLTQPERWWQRTKAWLNDYRPIWVIGLSASVFLLILLQYILIPSTSKPPQLAEMQDNQSYQTTIAESREVILQDGSKVLLDADSSIEVSYSNLQRRVLLNRGSAFFNVSHDVARSFVVTSGAVDIVVTGTEFDVQRKKNAVYVAVEQGSVKVSQPLPGWSEKMAVKNNQSWQHRKYGTLVVARLSAGQSIKADRLDGLGKVKKVLTESLAPWRRGKLVYINRSLGEVVQDMNRYSQQQIFVSPEAEDLKLSGTFDSQNIVSMLNIIEIALPVTLQQGKNGLYINLK